MKKLVLLGLLMVSLSACNTIAGVGDDVSDGARTVQGWMN
ncbi:entericidin [Thioclava sp. GXIMD4216]|uniref:Entericidin n=1 Tax=Thioclava litoralis TaxID=3076557 RepID=A0ABZ1DYP8_9RHOB|nr:entericidin [Thioclava sp. FTW29]